MFKMIKLQEKDIGSILNVYRSLERGIPPNDKDVDKALEYMYDYYEEYLMWYERYKKNTKDRMDVKVWREFGERYEDIEEVMFDNKAPLNKKVMVLDNAINQLHIDYPVLAHLQMEIEFEDDEEQEDKFNTLISTLENILKRQGKELPRVGYGGGNNPNILPTSY